MPAAKPKDPDFYSLPPVATLVGDLIDRGLADLEKEAADKGIQTLVATSLQLGRRASRQVREFAGVEDGAA